MAANDDNSLMPRTSASRKLFSGLVRSVESLSGVSVHRTQNPSHKTARERDKDKTDVDEEQQLQNRLHENLARQQPKNENQQDRVDEQLKRPATVDGDQPKYEREVNSSDMNQRGSVGGDLAMTLPDTFVPVSNYDRYSYLNRVESGTDLQGRVNDGSLRIHDGYDRLDSHENISRTRYSPSRDISEELNKLEAVVINALKNGNSETKIQTANGKTISVADRVSQIEQQIVKQLDSKLVKASPKENILNQRVEPTDPAAREPIQRPPLMQRSKTRDGR